MHKISEIRASRNTVTVIVGLLQMLLILFAIPGTGFAASVLLNWDPSPDADIAGYKVYYQAHSASLPFAGTEAAEGAAPIDQGNVTSVSINGLDPNNSYFFAVTAYNFAGLESVYSQIVELPESAAPVITVTSPSNNAAVNGIASLTANASDNVGVIKVQWFVNGRQVAESSTSPYRFDWDTSALISGTYTVSAKAFDAADNVGDSNIVTVTVAGDTISPTVSLAGPASNSTAGGTVVVSASATDNVKVARVEIFVDGTMVLSSNQSPVNYNWDTAAETNGSHILSAKAYDAAGNDGNSSAITVNVLNDSTLPLVNIASPVAGSMAGGAVLVVANASDNVALSKVEFYLNGTLQGSLIGAPYSFSWNTAAVANGAYQLTARAYDTAGNIGYSANVAVNVLNDKTAPTVTAFSMPATINSTTVSVLNLTATDDVAVTGYLITESATVPAASAAGWTALAPKSFTFAGTGSRKVYAWARDAVGHVSSSSSAAVLIDTKLPVISYMSLSSGSSSVTIKVAATDNVGVTRMELYLDNVLQMETSAASFSHVWSSNIRRSQTVKVNVYDAAGNVRTQSLRVSKI